MLKANCPDSDEITDTAAKELFERAVKEIITLASEDPIWVVQNILGDEIEIIYEDKVIDGKLYYETSAAFQDLYDYYSEIFTGDALNWILSTKFTKVDGTLYCSPAGGATGWVIDNLKVTQIGQDGGSFLYEATFTQFEAAAKSNFTVVKTENGFRIASIDYIPSLLRKW